MPGDIVFGSGTTYFGSNLIDAVRNGSVPMSRVDDMATRILGAWYLVGQDQPGYPSVNFDAFATGGSNNSHVDVQDDHRYLIRKIGSASTVLVKNHNSTLPFKTPKSIALIGSDAGPSYRGPNGYPDRGGDEGTLAMGWGSGTAQFPYLISPLEAIQSRAIEDNTLVSWWLQDFDLPNAQLVASQAEVTIVFINSDSGEEYITVDGNVGDRNNLTAWHGGDDLVLAVAQNCSNVVVVVHSVDGVIVEPWVDHPNVTAILFAGLPGQESGHSLVDILYGDYNPSARLPYTIAKNRTDYPAQIVYVNTDIDPMPHVPYTEKLEIDYRHFLAHNITPRYGFGYGLSYTTFEFCNMQVYGINGQCGTRRDGLDGVTSVDSATKPTSAECGLVTTSSTNPLTNASFVVTGKNMTLPYGIGSSVGHS